LDAALGEQLFDVALDRPKRRYQRTARTMTSGGKQKPGERRRPGKWWTLRAGPWLAE
jgi:hypothetical protein